MHIYTLKSEGMIHFIQRCYNRWENSFPGTFNEGEKPPRPTGKKNATQRNLRYMRIGGGEVGPTLIAAPHKKLS